MIKRSLCYASDHCIWNIHSKVQDIYFDKEKTSREEIYVY